MISKTWSRKMIAACVSVAVLSVYSMVALAAPGAKVASGELSVSGQVTVNGQKVISGGTLFSGSTIVTAANSSAIVSLSKLGRVELAPNSSLILNFTEEERYRYVGQGCRKHLHPRRRLCEHHNQRWSGSG